MTVTIEIPVEDESREEMYDELCQMFGEREVKETLRSKSIEHITEMFDNRQKLKAMEESNGNI